MNNEEQITKWIKEIDPNILRADEQGHLQQDSKPNPMVRVVFKGKKADKIMY